MSYDLRDALTFRSLVHPELPGTAMNALNRCRLSDTTIKFNYLILDPCRLQ
jgi:hypothetical protein